MNEPAMDQLYKVTSKGIQVLVPVGRCSELLAELNLGGYDQEELSEQDRIDLFRGCSIESYQHQETVKNRVEGCDYYLVVNGAAEIRFRVDDTATLHKRKLQSGGYFVNRVGQHRKLQLLPGCTILRIGQAKLQERAVLLKRAIQLFRLMKNSFPTNKMDSRHVRPLSKMCEQRRFTKGEWIMEEKQPGKNVLFLVEGLCRLFQSGIAVSMVQNCMVGEEILLQQTYSFGCKVESNSLLAFVLSKEKLLDHLYPSTISRLRKCYQERAAFRSKSLQAEVDRQKKKVEESDKAYERYKSIERVNRRDVRVDLSDNQLRETFAFWKNFKSGQMIHSRGQEQPSIDNPNRPNTISLQVTSSKPYFSSNAPNTARTSRLKTSPHKFKRFCCDSPQSADKKMPTEGSEEVIVRMNTERSTSTTPNLSKTFYQTPIAFSYRFENKMPDQTDRQSSRPLQNTNLMQDIDTRILKRAIIMSKRRVEHIYDNLQQERRRKQRMVRSMKGRVKGPINVHELYKLIVVGGKKS